MYVKIKYMDNKEKIKKMPAEYLAWTLKDLMIAFDIIKKENNNILDIRISQYLKAA